MKFPPFYAALICAGLMATPAHLSGQPVRPPAAAGPLGPRLTFATNAYHFGKVTGGTLVKYVFIFTNTGDQPLEISKVTPGCHCTTAGDWTHHIAPGQTGTIPIQFDSGNFRGDVSRTILVTSNDKLAPKQTLSLSGTIWRVIEVSPQFAYITVLPDAISNATSVVHITNQSDEPVTLSNPTSANGSFKAELKTLKPGKEFELTVTAVPPLAPGNTAGTISLKTSLTNVPELNITAIASMQQAVSVHPMQLALPPQIVAWTTNLVTITNNGNKLLALSDPEICCDKRASVELKTLVPGRSFQLAAIFPPGFQTAPGQTAQVSVKSDNASQPLIIVPIRQYPRHSITSPLTAQPKPMSQNLTNLPATGHP